MAKRNERVSLNPTLRHPPAPPQRQEGRCHIVRTHGGKHAKYLPPHAPVCVGVMSLHPFHDGRAPSLRSGHTGRTAAAPPRTAHATTQWQHRRSALSY